MAAERACRECRAGSDNLFITYASGNDTLKKTTTTTYPTEKSKKGEELTRRGKERNNCCSKGVARGGARNRVGVTHVVRVGRGRSSSTSQFRH